MKVVGWGANSHGQLGGGFRNASRSLVPLEAVILNGLAPVVQLEASYYFTAALLADGNLLIWGGNDQGELGNGTSSESLVPVILNLGVKQIAIGGAHVIALLTDGTVATWGGNAYGQIGDGSVSAHKEGVGATRPVHLGLEGIVSVAAGGGMCFAVEGDGSVWAWGENKQGQLGDGTTKEKHVPTLIPKLTGVKKLVSGGVASLGGHTLALMEDGSLVGWGGNGSGQLGDGTTEDSHSPKPVAGKLRFVDVDAAASHSLALDAKGVLYAWGNNANGELGYPTPAGDSPLPGIVPVGLVTSFAAGWRFSLAVVAGEAYSWGDGTFGTLGDGSQASEFTPTVIKGLGQVATVRAGEYHAMAIVGSYTPVTGLSVRQAGTGTLEVEWISPDNGAPWTIESRKTSKPVLAWSNPIKCEPSKRACVVSGLPSGVSCDVSVQGHRFGRRIISSPVQ
jgi:alpha-tubulin suppressor-like RCC1 family protein